MFFLIIIFFLVGVFLLKIYFDKKKLIIISIEGNIGVGKSTLVKNLEEKFGLEMKFLIEPIKVWNQIIDDKGNNILAKFYLDMNRWCYTFQNIAYVTRLLEILKHSNLVSGKKILVLDRSLEADLNIFGKMLYDKNHMEKLEWQCYCQWNDLYKKLIKYDKRKIIYLKSSPEIVFQRIKERNREEELTISIEYIKEIHDRHESWLKENKENIEILTINYDFLGNMDELHNEIRKFILL